MKAESGRKMAEMGWAKYRRQVKMKKSWRLAAKLGDTTPSVEVKSRESTEVLWRYVEEGESRHTSQVSLSTDERRPGPSCIHIPAIVRVTSGKQNGISEFPQIRRSGQLCSLGLGLTNYVCYERCS